MKTEIILLANSYMEISSWTDSKGSHSNINRTVDYLDVAGADAGDLELMNKKINAKINKYERIQPQ
jgi:hypothetical protein